jgi:hypothetical protein
MIFFKINGQEVATFQIVWIKSKIINLIELHHYVPPTLPGA